ncbi:hypothetical protein H6P81_009708 [Aristolochia fimbriata]|uniref:Uncharacterized protein n=1 Tax=Aristolochia fimbriata TaxID=158543 RepID=A0AAV7ELS4_ARIFI|nr:hypothetical protein H6P81_009708 [Aristolochia fimbriata]
MASHGRRRRSNQNILAEIRRPKDDDSTGSTTSSVYRKSKFFLLVSGPRFLIMTDSTRSHTEWPAAKCSILRLQGKQARESGTECDRERERDMSFGQKKR